MKQLVPGSSAVQVDEAGNVTFRGYSVSAGRKPAVVVKTADYTATANDEVIVCNKTTAMTITLPAATGSRQTYRIEKG